MPQPICDADVNGLLDAIDDAARLALADELACFPKPGLVSFVDQGSHGDMDAGTFSRSIAALEGYFADQARLGAAAASFETLRQRGARAETTMLAATRGVNTHRGAIFTLGLLAASAGFLLSRGHAPLIGRLSLVVRGLWGEGIASGAGLDPKSHGQRACRRHAGGGARAEAAAGFPTLRDAVWPRLAGGGDDAWLDALFGGMAVLHDTNILHRAGVAGLAFARREAWAFLAKGGAAADFAKRDALALHREFGARNISPGGSADLLAAAYFVARLQLIGPG
jgi:triphosphoribosyl-dephospho-CoA synthase